MFHRHTKAGTICRPVSGSMIPAVLLFHYFVLTIVRFVRQWPQQRAGAANRYDHSFLQRNRYYSALRVYFIYIADLIRLEFQSGRQKCFNIKSVSSLVCISCVFEIRVLW